MSVYVISNRFVVDREKDSDGDVCVECKTGDMIFINKAEAIELIAHLKRVFELE